MLRQGPRKPAAIAQPGARGGFESAPFRNNGEKNLGEVQRSASSFVSRLPRIAHDAPRLEGPEEIHAIRDNCIFGRSIHLRRQRPHRGQQS